MKKIKSEELIELIAQHDKWLKGEENGKQLDLSYTDLSGVNLVKANLSKSILTGANLSGAALRECNLEQALLNNCDLSWSNLMLANLSGANIEGAILYDALLYYANVEGIVYSDKTSGFSLIVPIKGSFTGFKKCAKNRIAELLIPADAKRISDTDRTCRADKAIVRDITNISGKIHYESARSIQDPNFKYVVGETVKIDGFDSTRFLNGAVPGIYFFLTRQEAVNYSFY